LLSSGEFVMPNPWDIIPKIAPRGDPHEDDIFRAVGRALTSWEYVEEEWADIFAILVNADMASPKKTPAMRAYGAIPTARSRADMLDAAGEAYFYGKPNPQLQSEFESVLADYRGLMACRNNIAHGRSGPDSATGQWYLYPGLYNSKKYPLSGPLSYLYSSVEIGAFTECFERLWNDAVEVETKF
jgi:hypothetical protein